MTTGSPPRQSPPAEPPASPVRSTVGWPPSADTTLAQVVATALHEDLGPGRDRTTLATVPGSATAEAMVRTRRAGVVAGLAALRGVWTLVDQRVTVELLAVDGDVVVADQVLARVVGPARSVFTGERTALNLVGHLSGVASLTATYVAAVGGRCQIRDTRKTTPGLRALEKAAVVAGGGHNHRFGLADALLVKDNHVAAAGGIAAATRAALAAADGREVQIEVDTLDQLDTVLTLGAPSVLLDNFDPDGLAEGVRRCRRAPHHVFVEASGGVTLDSVGAIAATGVDAVAVGALTHSAPGLDVGLDARLHGAGTTDVAADTAHGV